jgi:general stress protein CsbA
MNKEDFAFGKENFILIAISVVIIIIGFALMSGGGEEGASFNPEIFSTRRIVVAPVVCMIGFGLMVAAILTNSKDKKAA